MGKVWRAIKRVLSMCVDDNYRDDPYSNPDYANDDHVSLTNTGERIHWAYDRNGRVE